MTKKNVKKAAAKKNVSPKRITLSEAIKDIQKRELMMAAKLALESIKRVPISKRPVVLARQVDLQEVFKLWTEEFLNRKAGQLKREDIRRAGVKATAEMYRKNFLRLLDIVTVKALTEKANGLG